MSEIKYAQFESIAEESIRVTEGSDTRITEDDNVRITNGILNNNAESTLIAVPTKIPFTTQKYVKVNGTWKTIEYIFVNRNGSWVEPQQIYKNINGTWKRVK